MRIPFSVIILFTIFAEIAVFIVVGDAIGVAATLGLTLLAMIAGAVLLKRQSVATLNSIRAEVAAGRVPARPLAEGAVAAIAGLLLIAPGFLTDVLGILLFIPAVRSAIWGRMRRRLETARRRGAFRPAGPAVLELEPGEYEADPRPVARPGPPDPDSPWRRDGRNGS